MAELSERFDALYSDRGRPSMLAQAEAQSLLPREHFTANGTLIEAWASQKSFRPRDEEDPPPNGGADFRGQRRSNETHRSTTDPESRSTRKGRGKEAKLAYLGNLLNGLIVNTGVEG